MIQSDTHNMEEEMHRESFAAINALELGLGSCYFDNATSEAPHTEDGLVEDQLRSITKSIKQLPIEQSSLSSENPPVHVPPQGLESLQTKPRPLSDS